MNWTEYPSEVLSDFLYLGDNVHGSNPKALKTLKITNLVVMIPFTNWQESQLTEPKPMVKILHCNIGDRPTENISIYFDQAIEFINQAEKNNENVLVHCGEGISRAPTIVLAYLIKSKKYNLASAFMYLKKKRPVINPNNGFMRQLIKLDSTVHGKPSVDIEPFLDDWGFGCYVAKEFKTLQKL